MTQIELTPQEFPLFIRIAQQMKEKFTYTIIGSIIFLSASTDFLTKTGYL